MPASCIKYTIVVRGDTEEDRDAALSEAINRIKAGNLSGTDRNDDGGFYFDSTQDVPAGDWPA